MRIYAMAMALACMIHLGSISPANANATRLEVPEKKIFTGAGDLKISVPAGTKVGLGDATLLWSCNTGENEGLISRQGLIVTVATQGVYLSGSLQGRFSNGVALTNTVTIPHNAARKWWEFGPGLHEMGYDNTAGTNNATLSAMGISGTIGEDYGKTCNNDVNLWIGWMHKPAGICVKNGEACNEQGPVHVLIKRLSTQVVSPAGSVDLIYPDRVDLQHGETTELLEVRPASQSNAPVQISFSVSQNIDSLIRLTDNNGHNIVLGGAINTTSGAGYKVHVSAVGVQTPGTTSGEITITATSA